MIIFFMEVALAQHLGTFGETFNILEKDLLEQITFELNKLSENSEFQNLQIKIQNDFVKSAIPTPVLEVTKTSNPRVFFYDPSIKVSNDLKDHKGKIFVKANSMFNPLKIYKLREALLFIDGEDKNQVNWSLNYGFPCKIILTNGSPFKLMDKYLVKIYFDQHGSLVKKFGIKQIPAIVTQKGEKLQVEEFQVS